MNRRTLICAFASSLAGFPALGYAQSLYRDLPSLVPWKDIPAITVISTDDDIRLPAVREAIEFWNTELAQLGSPFRLGSPAHVVETDPPGGPPDLRNPLATETLSRMGQILSRMAPTGDIVVALCSDANFNPFALARPALQKVILPIPDFSAYGRASRNVVRHALAHELGHAIGLDHNDEADTLMCRGGPQCGYKFLGEGLLPLTSKEKTKLLEMYPPSWQPQPFKKWITDPPYLPSWQPRPFSKWPAEPPPTLG